MNAQLSRSLFLASPVQSRSRVRIVVLAIVGLHAVVLLGFLMQGYVAGQTNLLSGNVSPGRTGETRLQASVLPLGVPAAETTVTQEGPVKALEAGALPIPQTSVSTSENASTVEYTVVAGDTFARIAKQRHLSVGALLKANPQVNPLKLQIGQKIEIPAL